jgi:predicted HicB family RNase H-like nuclease
MTALQAGLRGSLDCYHLIGDALRGVQGADLCARIRARLDAEPTVLAPRRRSVPEPLAEKRYSGEFRVRIPPQLHRALALTAAEEGVSLNRLASAKLAA